MSGPRLSSTPLHLARTQVGLRLVPRAVSDDAPEVHPRPTTAAARHLSRALEGALRDSGRPSLPTLAERVVAEGPPHLRRLSTAQLNQCLLLALAKSVDGDDASHQGDWLLEAAELFLRFAAASVGEQE